MEGVRIEGSGDKCERCWRLPLQLSQQQEYLCLRSRLGSGVCCTMLIWSGLVTLVDTQGTRRKGEEKRRGRREFRKNYERQWTRPEDRSVMQRCQPQSSLQIYYIKQTEDTVHQIQRETMTKQRLSSRCREETHKGADESQSVLSLWRESSKCVTWSVWVELTCRRRVRESVCPRRGGGILGIHSESDRLWGLMGRKSSVGTVRCCVVSSVWDCTELMEPVNWD